MSSRGGRRASGSAIARRSSKRAGSRGATRIDRSGVAGGSRSSAGSWRRIDFSRSCRAGVGSSPSSPTNSNSALAVHGQSVGLASRAVEGQHQLAGQALAQWVLLHQVLEFRHDLPVSALREVGLDAQLEDAQAAAPRGGRSPPARSPRRRTRSREALARARAHAEDTPLPIPAAPQPPVQRVRSKRRRSSWSSSSSKGVARSLSRDRSASCAERLAQLRDPDT